VWDKDGLSGNPSVTPDFIQRHIQEDWDWNDGDEEPEVSLSHNPNITPEFVSRHFDKDWDWTKLSENPHMTPEVVRAHPDWPWNTSGLCRNPSTTLELVDTLTEKQWNDLSSRGDIVTPEYVARHSDKPWNWRGLSKELKLTPEFFEKHKSLPWSPKNLQQNPHVTPDILECFSLGNRLDWSAFVISPAMTPQFLSKHLDRVEPYPKFPFCFGFNSLLPEDVLKLADSGRLNYEGCILLAEGCISRDYYMSAEEWTFARKGHLIRVFTTIGQRDRTKTMVPLTKKQRKAGAGAEAGAGAAAPFGEKGKASISQFILRMRVSRSAGSELVATIGRNVVNFL
jgi:hypothetical protein